ncbi:MAG: TSUP family transporter [Anaerolineae bacterium]
MIATGLGELNDHFLLERCRVPSKVSVATGVFVVMFTTLSASVGHLVRFALVGGPEIRTMLRLVIFTIPGVILGGQLGPRVVSQFPQHALERGLHILLLLSAALTLVEAVL